MITWLSSYPRSGNTYLRIVLASLYGQRSTTRYWIGKASDRPLLFYEAMPTGSLEEMAIAEETYLVKTHDLPGADDHPALYVVRDGRDALVSYAKYEGSAHGKLPPIDTQSQAFRTLLRDLLLDDRSPFGTWGQNVLAWVRRPRTVVVRFEDMIRSPECVADAIARLGLDLRRQPGGVVPPFEALKQIRPANFQRGLVGGWRQDLSEELHKLFWRVCGPAMDLLGYGKGPRADGDTTPHVHSEPAAWMLE